MKENAYAGVAFSLTRGSVRPVTLWRYSGFTFASRGASDTMVRVLTARGAFTGMVRGTSEWNVHHVPFLTLRPVSVKGRPASVWSGEAVYQVEIGATRSPGETLSIEIDDVGFE